MFWYTQPSRWKNNAIVSTQKKISHIKKDHEYNLIVLVIFFDVN